MIFSQDRVTEIKLAYIGGGSKAWAWDLMSDLKLEESLGGTVYLYDIDHAAAKANEIIGNKLHENDKAWNYVCAASLEEALTGADFVVISILPGTLKEMESDVHVPEQYGIYQAVGDTVGPGGIVRAMRTLPMYKVIAEAIKAYCPKAWVINYTNPMTLCVAYMYEVFPEIKCFGCCHEVFGTQKVLAYGVGRYLEEGREVSREVIKTNVIGINHFTWINQATYLGEDIFPVYDKLVEEFYETGLYGIGTKPLSAKYFVSDNRVKFDLYKRYGIIAAAGDRHLAEFCPPWYIKDEQTAESWGFLLTPVSYRYQMYAERLEKSKRLISGEETLVAEHSGEEGVRQIKALLGLGDFVTNINMPNRGQIPNLPIGAVVEANALFTRNKVEPIFAGSIPSDVNALILPHVENQQAIVKATAEKNMDMVFKAFINYSLVTCSMNECREMFDLMVSNTRQYLDWWF